MCFHHVFNYTPLHEGDLHSQTVLANARVKSDVYWTVHHCDN